jgi:hypothetical protein
MTQLPDRETVKAFQENKEYLASVGSALGDDVPAGTPTTNYNSAPPSDQDVRNAYEAGKQDGIRVNRVPTWRRVAHYVVPIVTLVFGVGIGVAAGSSSPTVSTPTIPPQPTRATQQQVAPTTAVNAKTKAFDNLLKAAHERGSLSSLTSDQLHDVMDNFVCGNNDLMKLSNGYKNVSGSDLGYLWGANGAIGYC